MCRQARQTVQFASKVVTDSLIQRSLAGQAAKTSVFLDDVAKLLRPPQNPAKCLCTSLVHSVFLRFLLHLTCASDLLQHLP